MRTGQGRTRRDPGALLRQGLLGAAVVLAVAGGGAWAQQGTPGTAGAPALVAPQPDLPPGPEADFRESAPRPGEPPAPATPGPSAAASGLGTLPAQAPPPAGAGATSLLPPVAEDALDILACGPDGEAAGPCDAAAPAVPPAELAEQAPVAAPEPAAQAAPAPRRAAPIGPEAASPGRPVYVQIGAFANPANAERAVAALRALGYAVAGREVWRGGVPLRAIAAGPFVTPTEARAALDAARRAGYREAFVTR